MIQPLAFHALGRVNRREQPEVHVHRLEGTGALVRGLDMPAGDVIDQRAMGRGCGGKENCSPLRSAAAMRPAISPMAALST